MLIPINWENMKLDCNVSVIIVNYKTCNLVVDCIKSIYNLTKKVDFEIIVVDNNSVDGSVETIQSLYPQVQVIPLQENIGFGKANNVGVEKAHGKYVFFLNSDTVLLNNALCIFYEYMEANPRVGICGGNLYTAELSPNMSYAPFPSLWKEIISMLGVIHQSCSVELFNHGEKKAINGYISGADMFVRRSLCHDKFFDPDFFMYYEDVELSYRIKKRGYEIHSIPEAKIIHLQGMSTMGETSKLYLIQSKLCYFKKTSSFYPFLYSFYFVKSVVAIGLFSMIKNEKKKKFWQCIFNSLL